jgi:hypothetical protein
MTKPQLIEEPGIPDAGFPEKACAAKGLLNLQAQI